MSEPDIQKQSAVTVVGRYALGLVCVAVALTVTLVLHAEGLVSPLFFLAIIISAWFGGMGPGLLAALISTLSVAYFFLPPAYSFTFNPAHLPQLLVFFVSAMLVNSWSAVRRRADTMLRRARDEQETKVQERTADLKQANEKLQAEITERQRVEETLRQRADLLDLTHDTIFARDMNDVISYWNQGAEELYGWKCDDAVGRVSHELTQTIFPAPLQEINEALLRTGRWEGELIHAKRNGSKVAVSSRWSLQRDETGKPIAILETNNNITERKRFEEALREQASLLDLTHDTVFVRNMNDVITYWNRGAEELYGWKKNEAIGNASHELMQTIFPAPLEEINETLLGTDRWEGELSHAKRDGSKVVVASRWSLQRDEHGTPLAILEVNNDITERRRAEDALRDSEEQWKAAFENNPTMYFMVDAAGITLSVNAFGAEQLGYTADELVGTSVLNIIHEADRDAVRQKVASCFDQLNRSLNWEARKVRKNGTVRWVRETARAVLLKNRPVILIACEDVTERKRAEEGLRRSEAYLADAQRLTRTGSWAYDPRTARATYWSEEMFRICGLDPEQRLPGREESFQLVHPEDRDRVSRILGPAFTEKVEFSIDYRMLLPDGTLKYLHVIGHPSIEEAGDIIEYVGTAMDVTERKRAEEELRESERRYRYIFDAAGVSIWEEDFSQVKTAIDELKAHGVGDFRSYLATHPDFVRKTVPLVKVVDVNSATVELFKASSKAELLVSLEKIFRPETEEVFAGELIALAEGRTSFESETVLQTLEGHRLTVLFGITFPAQPAKLDSVLVTIMDITERKQAEEELHKTQAELAHIARVTTMGELTSSIAHEVNQPLAAIVTSGNACLRWLSNDPPNVEEAKQTVTRIVKDGHRASEVVGRIRAFFRKTAPEKVRVDLNQLVQDVIAMVPAELRRNRVQVRTVLANDLPYVVGDQIQLQQVLLNMVVNAIEAMSTVSGRRELLVESRRHEPGGVFVGVQDSGVGFDEQNAAQLFNAFFTTKPQGLGMGLSISRTAIEAYGGRLWATRNVGPGSTFQFTLPTGEGSVSNKSSQIAEKP